MKKLETFKEDNVKKGLKKYIPDSVLKKLNDTKTYYVNLGRDLKELGRDVVDGFKQPFMLTMLFMAMASLGALAYQYKHHNLTNVKKPYVIEQSKLHQEAAPKLVFQQKVLKEDEIGTVKKCKNLKEDYYVTLNQLWQSDLYQDKNLDSETKIVNDLSLLMKQMNRNTQNLQYNYATLIKEKASLLSLTDDRFKQILTQKNNLNENEEALVLQLGIYGFLENQLKVRQMGDKDAMMVDNLLSDQDRASFINGDKNAISILTKDLVAKDAGEICVCESLFLDAVTTDEFKQILVNLEKKNYNVNDLIEKARKQQLKVQPVEQELIR